METSDLLRTNPVLAIHKAQAAEGLAHSWARGPVLDAVATKLAARGQRVPEAAVAAWQAQGWLSAAAAKEVAGTATPGVCGLVVGIQEGCIVPLSVEPRGRWEMANARLPLQPDRLTRTLVDLLHEAGKLVPGVVPEARAFAVDSEFSRSCWGTSMDIAGVLAVLRQVAGEPACLDRACALVEPNGVALASVDGVAAKLQAFVRELGRGTVLVRHPQCAEAASFDAHFDEVWQVATLADLADCLAQKGLLDPWRVPQPLGMDAAEVVASRLRELEHEHRRVVDLCQRVLASSWDERVPPVVRGRHQLELMRSLRHLGRYQAAMDEAEAWRDSLRRAGETVCEEQLAEADLELAACLFDMAEYERMLAELEPSLQVIETAPLRFSPQLRARLWNTAARAMVRLDDDRWDSLFDRSLQLQQATDPASLPRTRNYRIEGMLRSGRLQDAGDAIAAAQSADPDAFSQDMLAFYAADLARRRGALWTDPSLEERAPVPGRANHPLGFYLQATARQPGRGQQEAVARFERAAACFEMDAAGADDANALWVLVRVCRLAVALHQGQGDREALAALEQAAGQPRLERLWEVLRGRGALMGVDMFEEICVALPWL